MTTRRPRPSLGAAVAGPSNMNKPSALEAFEDFRRRHVRQNKDIVIDNALRRTTVATLQEEIAKLHVELLELRQINVVLSSQVKRLQTEASRNNSQVTREALDQILGAIPALRQLRDTLGPNTPRSLESTEMMREQIGANSVFNMESKENPTATRPAAEAASRRGLPMLIETSEYGSDAEIIETDHLRVRRVPAERRRTEIGSVAVPRSPRPNTRPTPSDYFVIDSPESPAGPTTSRSAQLTSPSPRKVSKSPNGAKMKRRRESGLLLPRARSKTPPSVEAVEEIPDWEEGKNVIIPARTIGSDKSLRRIDLGPPPGDVAIVQIEGVTVPIPASSSRQASTSRITTSSLAPARTANIKVTSAREIVTQGSSLPNESEQTVCTLSTPSSVVANTLSEMDSLLLTDEDGGRGRRARRSVNYKEPSLTKKMRKPDGISVEEILGTGRPSLLPLITESEFPTSFSSAQSKRVLQHVSGPRRKSVLPRVGITRLQAEEVDEEDEEELGLSPDLAEVEEEVENEDPPSSPTDGEYIPSTSATPVSAPSATSNLSIRSTTPPKGVPRKAAIIRTSPRKVVVPKRPDIGIGRTSSGTVPRVISGSTVRTALGVRAEDNGVRKPIAGSTKPGAPPPRRPATTARRQSSAV